MFRFFALQPPASTPVIRVLDADARVAEVPLEPAKRPQFALTNSQCAWTWRPRSFDGGRNVRIQVAEKFAER